MLRELTLTTALEQLKKKKFSVPELYKELDESIADQKTLNVFLTLNKDVESDAKKAADSPLAGLPIAVKDNVCTDGLRTTASSTVLDNFIPQYDATVIQKLKNAGGVVLGKTNLDAWAHGSSTETSQYGRTLNPRNQAHLPGGSSGGSAAAVAADLCIASLGTETAGSIRQPAAWCGVVGLKPTYGRVSRYGIVSMASSTDSPGPIGKTVEDCAQLLNILAGQDRNDATTSPQTTEDYTQALVNAAEKKPLDGMKIGVVYFDMKELADARELVEPQLEVFRKLGAIVEFAQAMDPHAAIGVYTVVQRAEVSSNLARYDGNRYGNPRSFFGDEAKRRVMLGTYTLSKGYADKYYMLAQKVRTLFIEDYKKLFSQYDVLLSLTSPGFAKKIGASEESSMFGELEDMLVEPSSITGIPGISVPCYRDPKTNLFLGFNIMAPMWKESVMIKVADAFEKNTEWNTWRNA